MACRLLHPCPDEQVVVLGKGVEVVYEDRSVAPYVLTQLRVGPPSSPVLPVATPPATDVDSSCAAEEGKEEVAAPWEQLPEHLLAVIFAGLQAGGDPAQSPEVRKAQFSAMGVNREWRALCKHMFFREFWTSPFGYVHPMQLFTLCPPHKQNPFGPPVVRCFLVRIRGTGLPSFRLYMGDQTIKEEFTKPEEDAMLLLSAIPDPWSLKGLNLYYGKGGKSSQPIARVRVGAFGLHHHITSDASLRPYHADAHAKAKGIKGLLARKGPRRAISLGKVETTTRMNFMKPRGVKVLLPPTSVLDGFSPDGGHGRDAKLAEADVPSGDSKDAHCTTVAGKPPSSRRSWFPSKRSAVAPTEVTEGLVAYNKQPHWNEHLRCWCLNFKGRVKCASVKNFQLVQEGDRKRETIMQFGKVDTDKYSMDFNPHLLSAVQAFSIALSTFDGKPRERPA